MSEPAPSPASDRGELRNFGLVFGSGLVVIFGLFLPWLAERPWPAWPWIAAAVFVTAGLLYPPVLRPLHVAWMKLGHALGWINSRIILGVVFFVIFMPVRLLLGLLGRDPMNRKLEPDTPSYRVPSKSSPKDQLERPF